MEKAKYQEMIGYLKEDVAHVAVKVEGLERLAAILKEEELGSEWMNMRLVEVRDALQDAITTVERIRMN